MPWYSTQSQLSNEYMHEYSSKNINFRDFARAARDQNLRRASAPLPPDPRAGHPTVKQAAEQAIGYTSIQTKTAPLYYM